MSFLHWQAVHSGLQITNAEGGYEYRLRTDGDGVSLYQENRRTGSIEQRQACRDHDEAYRVADRWARNEALCRGPF